MATRKKAKTKARQAGKAKKKAAKVARKPAARKPTRAKIAAKKSAKAKPKSVPRKAGSPARPAPAAPLSAPPPGERIGVVTHYFNHLSVAIVQLETGSLRAGELVRIKGHTSDFTQPVESMELDHVHVDEVHAGQSFGLRVQEHAREHDVVYKVVQ